MAYMTWGKKKAKIRNCKGGRVQYSHTCDQCNDLFVSNRKTAKYCSEACRQKFYHHKKKENS